MSVQPRYQKTWIWLIHLRACFLGNGNGFLSPFPNLSFHLSIQPWHIMVNDGLPFISKQAWLCMVSEPHGSFLEIAHEELLCGFSTDPGLVFIPLHYTWGPSDWLIDWLCSIKLSAPSNHIQISPWQILTWSFRSFDGAPTATETEFLHLVAGCPFFHLSPCVLRE